MEAYIRTIVGEDGGGGKAVVSTVGVVG